MKRCSNLEFDVWILFVVGNGIVGSGGGAAARLVKFSAGIRRLGYYGVHTE